MLQLHKRKFIQDLLAQASSSFEAKASEMVQDWDWMSTHPSGAERLLHAAQMSQQKAHPATQMTRAGWFLVGLGVMSLAKSCFSDAMQIWESTFLRS